MAQPPTGRALLLLEAACPETPPDALARLSVGQRDARLLTLREWAFGSQLASLVNCPACGMQLEFTLDISDIRVLPVAITNETHTLNANGYELRFRLPNSLDLLSIMNLADVARARRSLFARCLLAATREGEDVKVGELPPEVAGAVVAEMERLDPQATVELSMDCPDCEHKWQSVFDIVTFFWGEISIWSQRLLREIHLLASAYGWRESDTLALSPWRRRFYVEMVRG